MVRANLPRPEPGLGDTMKEIAGWIDGGEIRSILEAGTIFAAIKGIFKSVEKDAAKDATKEAARIAALKNEKAALEKALKESRANWTMDVIWPPD